jgi:hypothetical protein
MTTNTDTYRVVRFYDDPDHPRVIVRRGLTLTEARAHCNDPETSASTATSPEARRHTAQHGAWFDGYENEPEAERATTDWATRTVVLWARNDETSYTWWCSMAREYAGAPSALAAALALELPNRVHVGDLSADDWPSVDWSAVAEACADELA